MSPDQCCEVCGCPQKYGVIVVDYFPGTDKPRGYLCKSCDDGIAALGDNSEGIQQLMAYLKKYGARPKLTVIK